MIHLDTHVIVWLYAGLLEKFSEFAKKQLEENDLIISPIVQLELQYLYEIKRITVDSKTILNELTQQLGIQFCNVSLQQIVQNAIDLNWTRDPFDRLIVSTANIEKAYLLSKDKMILQHYKHTIWN